MPDSIRRAVAADAAELHEVAAATFALACPPGTRQQDIDAFVRDILSVERFESYLADSARELLVAVRADRLIGYTMLVAGEPKDTDVASAIAARPTIELSKCYLLAGEHGAGVASALMVATLEAARAAGAAGVWLGVNQQNGRANRFYEKHGFAVVGTKRFLVGDEWHDDFTRERVFGS
ncbi:GNAT family N-acetyltransferase [Lacisediminihabitans sp.]|jgi:ribosomal protein S18 acetylase RimI-like enzyme|uniref:GNAT family N-acetyltransferase n=1 Tax=Lacisediminihabitans sp. TaxID=2787631 RepID=UPI002F953ABB